jgi:eukaryotic-like serine/threonine-protein kinase
MMLAPGARIGSYEIIASLGAGGMGEVYRARDARLGRDVAIKILPRTFAEDAERQARFGREARVLASLNHPNIAQIYDSHDADGAVAIVMELVEGEDLAARIARGRLTWSDARRIVRQLADGLDAAHERGIIHRDLKPANIRITPEETVKILDFGLAKTSISGKQDPALSPTITSSDTHLGTIIGTAAYMAPEQAKGRTIDKRVDIWAFGVVAYEMLTARSPFAGESAIESLGLVVASEPEWGALPSTVPPRIVELLKRCLVKDPKARLRDIGDFIHVLETDVDAPRPASTTPSVAPRSSVLPMIVLALALAAAAAAAAWMLKPSASVPVPLRRLLLPDAIAGSSSVALSPDGTRIAYVSDGRILVRRLDETHAQELTVAPRTTNFLVWAPDGRTLGFYVAGTIRTVPVTGGPVFTVASVPGSGRITGILWDPDGSIVFATWRDSLYRVPQSGGTPEVLLKVDPVHEVDFHEISLVSHGRLLISVHLRAENAVRTELVTMASGKAQRTILTDDGTVRDFQYATPGQLLFLRVGDNEGVWALPFAEEKLNLAKATMLAAGATSFSVSNEGTLVARTEVPPTSTLEWVRRDGSVAVVPGQPLVDLSPYIAVSAEGDRVAYVAGRTQPVLFVRDLETGADTRLVGETSGLNVVLGPAFSLNYPGWFPRGGRLFYAAGPIEGTKLIARRADGSGSPTPLTSGTFGRVSSDGRWFVWIDDERGTGRVHYAPLNGDTLSEAQRFAGTETISVSTFDLSPDGRLLAYAARDTSQQLNVYLVEFPGAAARWQVTTDGGTRPQFSADGKELLFMTGSVDDRGIPVGRLMSIPFTREPSMRLGVPKAVLSGAAMPDGFATAPGGRLLVVRAAPVAAGEGSRAVLVQNWPLLTNGR